MLEPWSHTSPAQQVVAGPRAVDAVAEHLRALGVRRALVVTSPTVAEADVVERLVRRAGRVITGTVASVEPHVPAHAVEAVVREVHGLGADGLISVGGGSSIDTAKAAAFLLERHSGMPGVGVTDRPGLPHLAVPITLVGAPYTASFSMVDPASRRSTTGAGPTLVPSSVLLDLDALAELPSELFARSVAVALAHGIEVAWSSASSPEARALALAGVARLAAAAPGAIDDVDDLDRRGDVLVGAVLCGRARQNSADGLQQALAQLVGARAQVGHAEAHAALLPHTTRFLADVVDTADHEALSRSLGGDDPAGAVQELLVRIGAHTTLGDLGVHDDDLEAVARQSGSHRGVQTALRPVGESDVRALLEDAC
ncbi:iron-containing alcohol dehydrogenase [Actinomarinicola tropica]|uniref:Iron-containing alcohol dehydrogenase n=1 Tax=Actinomarinicola tropica TaxID=2789776 RepID=A0A5Q2RD84_9ACTN|nr:iron-containing alcohol dehydrogenase [Actinomarinicola tropica]QGG94818.1 iron-containing alcohol dehydrogenase [Actinomarinicola tropica]